MFDPNCEQKCSECGKALEARDDEPPGEQGWCSTACCDAWYAARPEEAAKWTDVRDLTLEQHAELRAILGEGGKA